MTDDVIEPPVAERRGRPAGLPKSGGRKPGTPNAITKDLKELILRRGKPVELLCDIARGVRIRTGPQAGPGEPTFTYPNLQDRAAAARVLLDRVLPAMKAIEMGGPDGGPITVADSPEAIEARAAALERLGHALRGGVAGQGKPAGGLGGQKSHPPRKLPTPSSSRISQPIYDVVRAPPAGPDLPDGYELRPAPDGVVVVLHRGDRVFTAASQADALNFISQSRPMP